MEPNYFALDLDQLKAAEMTGLIEEYKHVAARMQRRAADMRAVLGTRGDTQLQTLLTRCDATVSLVHRQSTKWSAMLRRLYVNVRFIELDHERLEAFQDIDLLLVEYTRQEERANEILSYLPSVIGYIMARISRSDRKRALEE